MGWKIALILYILGSLERISFADRLVDFSLATSIPAKVVAYFFVMCYGLCWPVLTAIAVVRWIERKIYSC